MNLNSSRLQNYESKPSVKNRFEIKKSKINFYNTQV